MQSSNHTGNKQPAQYTDNPHQADKGEQ